MPLDLNDYEPTGKILTLARECGHEESTDLRAVRPSGAEAYLAWLNKFKDRKLCLACKTAARDARMKAEQDAARAKRAATVAANGGNRTPNIPSKSKEKRELHESAISAGAKSSWDPKVFSMNKAANLLPRGIVIRIERDEDILLPGFLWRVDIIDTNTANRAVMATRPSITAALARALMEYIHKYKPAKNLPHDKSAEEKP